MNVWPYIMAIAGPSCSGKSNLARLLANQTSNITAAVLPLDAYYHDLSHLDMVQRAQSNFDVPDILDIGLFLNHLQALVRGESIFRPIYDFATHTRFEMTERIEPVQLIIVEGVLTLYWEEVRALADIRIFIDVPGVTCLQRRLLRDTRERARTQQSVLDQFSATVWPMYEQYAYPTRTHADLLVDGTCAPQDILAAILPYTPLAGPDLAGN